jgi:hypothetical protein
MEIWNSFVSKWNSVINKFYDILCKIKLERTFKVAGREIPHEYFGFALILVVLGLWAYVELEVGRHKGWGALIVILMAWGVVQLGALDLGDGVGEKPELKPKKTDKPGAE